CFVFGGGANFLGEPVGGIIDPCTNTVRFELIDNVIHVVVEGISHRYRNDLDRKSTRLNSSHVSISYAVFCLKKKKLHRDRYNYIRTRSQRSLLLIVPASTLIYTLSLHDALPICALCLEAVRIFLGNRSVELSTRARIP